ncbi:right-handed parallel beta-helix repeat-containing protein, partial [Streptomyces seoulensis]
RSPASAPSMEASSASSSSRSAVSGTWLDGNRIGDDQAVGTQTHGLRVTADGDWSDCRVFDNDLGGNAVAATRFDTPPAGGRWRDNDE